MDYLGIQTIKEGYAQNLSDKNDVAKAIQIITSGLTEPITKPIRLHPEHEYSEDSLNALFTDIAMDIAAIDNEMSHTGLLYSELMHNVANRLDAVDEALRREENRIKDLNTICSNYTEFTSIKQLTKEDVTGSVGVIDNSIFCANYASAATYLPSIISIEGNGYEGNNYVYNKTTGSLLADTINTKDRSHVTDENSLTKYEYSRLTATGNKDPNSRYPQDTNFDTEEASCTITMQCDTPVTLLKLETDTAPIIVDEIFYSDDGGATYLPSLKRSLEINNYDKIYTDPDYIYQSGIVSFPETNYVKIQLRSNGVTKEPIAFKTVLTDNAEKPIETIVQLPNVNRHVISLNNIFLQRANYATGVLETGELITTPVESLAIFANEYIPSYMPNQDYFKYILTINGVDHEIVPINSNRKGSKVIRLTSLPDSYADHISESIKSAKLRVMISTPAKNVTPFLSNLKVCYGKAAK